MQSKLLAGSADVMIQHASRHMMSSHDNLFTHAAHAVDVGDAVYAQRGEQGKVLKALKDTAALTWSMLGRWTHSAWACRDRRAAALAGDLEG